MRPRCSGGATNQGYINIILNTVKLVYYKTDWYPHTVLWDCTLTLYRTHRPLGNGVMGMARLLTIDQFIIVLFITFI